MKLHSTYIHTFMHKSYTMIWHKQASSPDTSKVSKTLMSSPCAAQTSVTIQCDMTAYTDCFDIKINSTLQVQNNAH